MKIKSARFDTASVNSTHFPPERKSILLLGRSNVGKSSFINTVLNSKNMARTSGKPGKTIKLNFFMINEEFYFVDAPGYGYAKVSKKMRAEFGMMIEEFIITYRGLRLAVLLVDSRHKPSDDDIMMYQYLKYFNIPVLIIATKVDKISRNKRLGHKKMIETALGIKEDGFLFFSAVEKDNLEQILFNLEEGLKKESINIQEDY